MAVVCLVSRLAKPRGVSLAAGHKKTRRATQHPKVFAQERPELHFFDSFSYSDTTCTGFV